MKKEKIDNKCIHCKYGVKEYARLSGAFIPIRCTDCTCPIVTARESKQRIKNKVKCNYYELDETETHPIREIVSYKLVKMADKIDEIAKMLKRMDS